MGGVSGRGVALTVKGPSWRGIDTIEKGREGFWGGGLHLP